MSNPLKRESVIEAMASAIVDSYDEVPTSLAHGICEAALSAAESAGFVLVPKEATEEMIRHGYATQDEYEVHAYENNIGPIYAAMIAAHLREDKT